MKPIKFDLRLKEVKITNFEELQDNFSAEILPDFQSGKLAKWLKSRDMPEQALAVEAIDKNDSEFQQLQGICQVLGLDADEEVLQYLLDDRQAPQAAPSVSVAEASEDEDETEVTSAPSTSGVDWSGQNMRRRSFVGEDLRNANLKGTNFSKADLSKTDLSGADLSGADLTEADLSEATLISANLTGAKLISAWLYNADCTEANFTKADLSGAYGWKNKKDGWGSTAHIFEKYEMDIAARINFTKADFTDANLDRVDFKRSNFTEANLTRASMTEGCFHLSNFSGANLTAASLEKAKLYDTNFTKADLSFANLTGAVYSKDGGTNDETMVNLTDTRLTGVIGFNRPKV